jgi:hypothetical protein
MNNLYKSILGIGLLTLSNPILSAGWIYKNNITKIAFQSEHIFLYSNDWNNPNDCGSADAVVLEKGSANFDKAYPLLLAAFMAGRDISGYSDGCVTWDEKSYNTIRGYKYLTVY